MATFDGLDIPDGYFDLFNALLFVGNNGTSICLNPVVSAGDTTKQSVLYNRSLFGLWEPDWVALTTLQKETWVWYWTELMHDSGITNFGWPGSGYSGFVFSNAARRRNGLAPYADAPYPLPLYYIKPGDLSGVSNVGIYGNSKIAQQYTPTYNQTCTSIGLNIQDVYGSPSDNLVLNIYEGGASPEAGTLVAGPIAVSLAGITRKKLDFRLTFFDIGSTLSLWNGTPYFFVYTRSGGPSLTSGFYVDYIANANVATTYPDSVGWDYNISWVKFSYNVSYGFAIFT